MNTQDLPKTLVEAIRHFADPQVCHDFMVALRWPDGKVTCPRCASEKVGFIKTRRTWQCKQCQKQFSTKLGTIFSDSPLGLDKWLPAVWLIANCKNGVSSYELSRALGITQKSTWFMLHRIRLALQTKSFDRQLRGEVEGDETFIGGRVSNMHKNKRKVRAGTAGKAIVQGLLERGGELRAVHVPSRKSYRVQRTVRRYVEKGSSIYTDTSKSYEGLDYDYIHKMVDHSKRYVEGRVHTNGLENFWSLLKRTLHGTYVAVDPGYLWRYLDEQVFRFNKRKGNDASRFLEAMLNAIGKRLTLKELTTPAPT